jgi:hypothetical protein
MAASEDSEARADLASETVAPIKQELLSRLSGELGDRDVLAVESALLKAFLGGMQAGANETADAAAEQMPVNEVLRGEPPITPAQFDLPIPKMDPWAARYGND